MKVYVLTEEYEQGDWEYSGDPEIGKEFVVQVMTRIIGVFKTESQAEDKIKKLTPYLINNYEIVETEME